jgi:hypothetical protein
MNNIQYFSVLPPNVIHDFYRRYLPKEMDVIWGGIWWWVRLHIPDEAAFVRYIVSNGYIRIFPFARDNGYMKYYSASLTTITTAKGCLEALQWLYANNFHLSPDLPYYAVVNGHLRILLWLNSIGITCDGEETMHHAIESDNIDILEYLYKRGYPLSRGTYNKALKRGNTFVIQWFIAKIYSTQTLHKQRETPRIHNQSTKGTSTKILLR